MHSQQQMAAAIKSVKEAMFIENWSNFDFCHTMQSTVSQHVSHLWRNVSYVFFM